MPFDVAQLVDALAGADPIAVVAVAPFAVALAARPGVQTLPLDQVDRIIGLLLCEAGQRYDVLCGLTVRQILDAHRCVTLHRQDHPRHGGCAFLG